MSIVLYKFHSGKSIILVSLRSMRIKVVNKIKRTVLRSKKAC